MFALGGTAVGLTTVLGGLLTEWQLDGLHADIKEDMAKSEERLEERINGLQVQITGLSDQITALSDS